MHVRSMRCSDFGVCVCCGPLSCSISQGNGTPQMSGVLSCCLQEQLFVCPSCVRRTSPIFATPLWVFNLPFGHGCSRHIGCCVAYVCYASQRHTVDALCAVLGCGPQPHGLAGYFLGQVRRGIHTSVVLCRRHPGSFRWIRACRRSSGVNPDGVANSPFVARLHGFGLRPRSAETNV